VHEQPATERAHPEVLRHSGLRAAVEVHSYLIVAEALTNLVKHAHANAAEIHVALADRVLRIRVRADSEG